MPKDVILTPKASRRSSDELDDLQTTKRREVAERIKEAREFGDISENSEYDDAKNEQMMLEQKIAQLEERLRSAQVVDTKDLSTDVVQVGVTVNIKDEKTGEVAEVHDRRLGRGEPGGEQALQRVAGRHGAARAQAQRHRRRSRSHAARRASSRSPRSTSACKAAMAEEEGSTSSSRRGGRSSSAFAPTASSPFPHAYPGVTPISAVHAAHADLPAGEDTEARYRVAGRLHARRGQGKMAFLDLDDRSGRIQLQARADVLGEEAMARLLDLDLGDIVGVDGVAFRSRRGELSLRVEDFELLAKSLRPPPDKFHGLQDVETRFRHRELDLIANEEARALFIARAKVITRDPRATSTTRASSRSRRRSCSRSTAGRWRARSPPTTTRSTATLYLRIATELYLKRLIVGGLERVYELGKDFRNEGISYKHNPEFTMVEWYEAYADYERRHAPRRGAAAARGARPPATTGEIDFTPPCRA